MCVDYVHADVSGVCLRPADVCGVVATATQEVGAALAAAFDPQLRRDRSVADIVAATVAGVDTDAAVV